MKCKYELAWVGSCSKETVENSEFCEEHIKEKCSSCGAQATRQCYETGQFVCGVPLCDSCEHTIHKDGTNGGIGFRKTSELPEGYKDHCKKEDQVYLPWWHSERTK